MWVCVSPFACCALFQTRHTTLITKVMRSTVNTVNKEEHAKLIEEIASIGANLEQSRADHLSHVEKLAGPQP